MIIHDISLNHIVLYQLGVVNMIRPLIIDNVFPVLSKFRNASQAIHHWFFWGYPVLAYTMQVHKASSYWLPLLRLLRVLRPWDPCISQQRCFEQVDHGRTLKGPSVHQISQETHHLRSIPHLQVSPCGETAGGASAARYAQLASDDQWWLYDTVDTESPFVQVLFRSDLRWTEFGLLRWPWDAMGCHGMPGDARGRGNHLPGKLPFTWIHWHQWEVGRSSKIPLNKNIFHQKSYYATQGVHKQIRPRTRTHCSVRECLLRILVFHVCLNCVQDASFMIIHTARCILGDLSIPVPCHSSGIVVLRSVAFASEASLAPINLFSIGWDKRQTAPKTAAPLPSRYLTVNLRRSTKSTRF